MNTSEEDKVLLFLGEWFEHKDSISLKDCAFKTNVMPRTVSFICRKYFIEIRGPKNAKKICKPAGL